MNRIAGKEMLAWGLMALLSGLSAGCSQSSTSENKGTSSTGDEDSTSVNDVVDTTSQSTDSNQNPGGSGTDSDSSAPDENTDDPTTDSWIQGPCEDAQHVGCYGEEIWCVDAQDTPKTRLEECQGGERCLPGGDIGFECRCQNEARKGCHNKDVWTFDSCDDLGSLVKKCEDGSRCVEDGEGDADCCVSAAALGCSDDGNIHRVDSCGNVEELVEECGEKSSCSIVDGEPTCACRNHWTGKNCDECPVNFTEESDCTECRNYFTGENCETCEGWGDRCQCESLDHVPQPGTDKCWTCLIGEAGADGGKCPNVEANYDPKEFKLADAREACPDGFDIPSIEDFVSIYSKCQFDDFSNIDCGECSDDNLCRSMFGNSLDTGVWSSDECKYSNYIFLGHYGLVGDYACEHSWYTVSLVCVQDKSIGGDR